GPTQQRRTAAAGDPPGDRDKDGRPLPRLRPGNRRHPLPPRTMGRQRLPSRIKGTAIPIEARVFAVADALDARTSDRPYRRAEPWRTAVRRLARGAGSQFDPAVIIALQHETDRLEE